MRLVPLLLIFLLLAPERQVSACFIMLYKDGENVLVANHEDWFTNDAAIRFNASKPGRYGSVIFTFLSEGWAQGGMNERGLFFDAAQTPYQEITFDDSRKKSLTYIWQEILDRAATVQEALDILNEYELPELAEASIMLADASGEAAIVGVKNNQIAVQMISENHLIQTNFNIWHPELSEDPVCKRYLGAQQVVESSAPVTPETMRKILEQTHQDSLTVYSNIYDLKKGIIYTYNKRDFNNPITIEVSRVLDHGDCMLSLDSLKLNPGLVNSCPNIFPKNITVKGRILHASTGEPLAFANIGVYDKNLGTLSDPDGSFEIVLPPSSTIDTLLVSSIGFETEKIPIGKLLNISKPISIKLLEATTMLDQVEIRGKKLAKRVERLGWMGGRDGILPLDTIMGGGVVALLVESPSIPFRIEKLQVRLMYNSKDTLKFRLHVYEFDSITQRPGKDLLQEEIFLNETKKFGWVRFDLNEHKILIDKKKICVGFEWIEDLQTRKDMLDGLRQWEAWKKDQFAKGNEKVKYLDGVYKYHGNMMDWRGFGSLPPFTGLMVQTGKSDETSHFRTFERKTSFGKWEEINSTLSAVITINY